MTYDNRDPRRNIGALFLIGLGVLFLFGQLFGFSIGSLFNFAWPFFIIIPGVLLLFAAMTGGRSLSGLAIPGTVVTGTGLLLFFQATFDYYQSWAYAWALYPGFVGAGLLLMGLQRGDRKQVEIGQNMMRGALIVFAIFAGFFELFIFHRISGLGNVLVPLFLIGGGIFLLSGGQRHGMRAPFAPMVPPAPPAPPQWPNAPRPFGPFDADKRKNDEKAKNDPRPKWDLNRRIEEAIREDEPEGFV